ncbi:hypothetical protein KIN20_036133 [Parelaphostrongylus tenuis]|uniref:Uncharacterized protein n=1 Tax=Parelaphostrongylus tenuis TaxID=148309 RepID=A0AAD5RFP3_PARTN|nr:hypothetical protein KIN20_036133 [Parelaphostrongylus tenuis]
MKKYGKEKTEIIKSWVKEMEKKRTKIENKNEDDNEEERVMDGMNRSTMVDTDDLMMALACIYWPRSPTIHNPTVIDRSHSN